MSNNELKIMVPKGWGVNEEVMSDGSRVFTVKLDTATADDTDCNQREGIFKLVPASQLSLEDGWMKYQPKTKAERNFKEMVETAIKSGLKDFYRPTLDPSFDDEWQICYQAGMEPAVGKSFAWWEENAKKLGYRLGTYSEYIAFLAVLIKEMVASGKSLEWAWNAVCNDSEELGNYWNSSDSKHELEATGNREVCGWCDLANTYKILEEDKENGVFWLTAGGDYYDNSVINPLADLHLNFDHNHDFYSCTGWLVLS